MNGDEPITRRSKYSEATEALLTAVASGRGINPKWKNQRRPVFGFRTKTEM